MTHLEKSIENFLKQLEFDSDFYDVHSKSELLEYARNFLQSYGITILEGCNYRNDQDENGYYYCDMASERGDSQVDIYYCDLWEKAQKFQYFIEESINDFLFDKSRKLTDIFQFGQYLYYSRLAWDVLNNLADYVKA